MKRWERLRRLETSCEVSFKSFLRDGELWWRATARQRQGSHTPLVAEAHDLAAAVLALADLAVKERWIRD